MATYIKRTLKTFAATQVKVGKDENGILGVIKGDTVTYTAPSENAAAARAAFKAAGIDCPRGTQLDHELVSEQTYRLLTETFMELAELTD